MTKRRLVATAFFIWAVSAHFTHSWLTHFMTIEPPHNYAQAMKNTETCSVAPDLADFARDYQVIREALDPRIPEGQLLAFVQAELRSLYWQAEIREIPPTRETVLETVDAHLAAGRLPASLIYEAVFRGLARVSKKVRYRGQVDTYAGLEPAGIGAVVEQHPRGLKLVSLLPDHPAVKAGLQAGDVITSVDGEALVGRDISEALHMIRGYQGQAVKMTVQRGTGLLLRSFELEMSRQTLVTDRSLALKVQDGVATVEVLWFDDSTTYELQEALTQAEKMGATRFVLDLTHASVGSVNAAAECAAPFLHEGSVVAELRAKNHTFEVMVGVEEPRPCQLEVRIGPMTRQGGEVLAHALREFAGVRLSGEATAGDGVVVGNYWSRTGVTFEVPRYQIFIDEKPLAGHGLRPNFPTLMEMISQ